MGVCWSDKAGSSEGGIAYVKLDESNRGSNISITEGSVISGHGTILADSVLEQEKAYFEVRVLTPGLICVGVAQRSVDLTAPLQNTDKSWVIRSESFAEGDVIACMFDQSFIPTLSIEVNGKAVDSEDTNREIKGEVHPAFSVANGASISVNLGQKPFSSNPPAGYNAPMVCHDIM